MPSTIFCHLASLSLSEPISFISISPRLSIWSGGCSEARPISLLFLECTPQPSANPSPRLISLFDVVYLILIYIFIFKIYVSFWHSCSSTSFPCPLPIRHFPPPSMLAVLSWIIIIIIFFKKRKKMGWTVRREMRKGRKGGTQIIEKETALSWVSSQSTDGVSCSWI